MVSRRLDVRATLDAASPAGQAARAQAMRLLSAAGADEALYVDELRRVLNEVYEAEDLDELSSRLATLIDTLVLIAGAAMALALGELHEEGAIERAGLLLAIDRTVEKLVADASAQDS